jgi:nucleoside-diphosphate-sugar epimerase
MAILVTGAGGFIGRHLVEKLVRRHDSVRALTRKSAEFDLVGGAQWITGNVCDPTALTAAVRDVTTVYHLAARIAGRANEPGMRAVNVGGTRNVAVAAVRGGVKRVVLVSSVAVYRPPLAQVVAETAPTDGNDDPYGRSKVDAELEAKEICKGKVELVILRPCQVYGPNDGTGYTARMMGLCRLPVLPICGWRARNFSLIHVRDLTAALCAAGDVEGIDGGIFNIASETKTSLLDLASTFAEVVGRQHRAIGVPVPAFAIRGALSLRGAIFSLYRQHWPIFKSYAPAHCHGSLLLGGPMYATVAARARLEFRPGISLADGLTELISATTT